MRLYTDLQTSLCLMWSSVVNNLIEYMPTKYIKRFNRYLNYTYEHECMLID